MIRPGVWVLLALGVLLGLPGASPASEDGGVDRAVRVGRGACFFDGTLDEALLEARARNVPLLVLAALEGEEENDRFRESFLGDVSVIEATDRAVVLVVNNGQHASAEIPVPGSRKRKASVCSVYEVPTCATHARNWDAVYLRFIASAPHQAQKPGGVDWTLPGAVIVEPSGDVFARVSEGDPPALAAILASVDAAAEKAGPGMTLATWDHVVALRDTAEGHRSREDWGAAWQVCREILAATDIGVVAREARELSTLALEHMRRDLDHAVQHLAPNFVDQAYRRLHRWRVTHEGSPLEKDVRAALLRAQTDPELKDIVAPLRTELEAEDLLVGARRHHADGAKRPWKSTLRKLLAPPYEATPAAETARKEFPVLAKKLAAER